MKRREFLKAAAGLGGFALCRSGAELAAEPLVVSSGANGSLQAASFPTPAYSVTPVVGDGAWIWTSPPKDSTGYLEPRTFDLDVGIELEGTGPASQLKATTVAPVRLPEQDVQKAEVLTEGCEAQLRGVSAESGQLLLGAESIVRGQVIRAVAKYRLRISKEYQAYERDQFPPAQTPPKEFLPYLIDSPGIQTRDKGVRDLAKSLGSENDHPWDKAQAFHKWVWENIKPLRGYFTSVLAALKNRTGDCEERAAVFVAFCRSAGIPARLVWVPNHNWAEFWLQDEAGKGHWIPAHTSAYNWFGWTGAHELVLQKGDKVFVPEDRKPQRLLADWLQWQGARPKVRFAAELRPVPETETSEAGPGARSKDKKGEWLVVSDHPADRYGRK